MRKKLEELRLYVESLWQAENVQEMQGFYKGLIERIDALLKEQANAN